jgi:ABC-type transport system involved in multi-copper enzyme maturation permease subunit
LSDYFPSTDSRTADAVLETSSHHPSGCALVVVAAFWNAITWTIALAMYFGGEGLPWFFFLLIGLFVAIGLWLVFVVLYDLLLFGALTMDKDQLIGQQLFSMLMLVSPTDSYRVLNLSSFEGVSEAAGIAGVASEAGLSGTLLISAMLLWVVAPLMGTLLVFQRREL